MNKEHRQELQRLAELPIGQIGENENNVKYKFIIPFLESFGFKKLDFEHSAQGNRIDILIDEGPGQGIVIEAKSYGKNLDDYIPQLKRYCDEKRPILALLCNGQEIRFYSPFWRKAKFSETLIYSITRSDLSNNQTVERIEAVFSKESLPTKAKRQLGRKGYTQVEDYLIPVIRLIRNGDNHTNAFHKIANELGVEYSTVSAQCTRNVEISTEKFVDLIKSTEIKSFLKETFPKEASLIEKEL